MHFKYFEGLNSRIIKRTIFEIYIVSNLYHDILSMISTAMEKNEFILLKYIEIILDNNIAFYNYN